jgi:hypothetical protein
VEVLLIVGSVIFFFDWFPGVMMLPFDAQQQDIEEYTVTLVIFSFVAVSIVSLRVSAIFTLPVPVWACWLAFVIIGFIVLPFMTLIKSIYLLWLMILAFCALSNLFAVILSFKPISSAEVTKFCNC